VQTNFSLAQLADPHVEESNRILRTCVHCGFCTATCPTYLLLNDELDSPRGRIYLIKDMLEQGRPATADVVTHIDRCLSCLSCMTTCPSGVHYMHLVDHARAHIEKTYKRPLIDRMLRGLLVAVLPDPLRFRRALMWAKLGRPFASLFERLGLKPVAAMLRLAPRRLPRAPRLSAPHVFPAAGPRTGRVALLAGCAGQVLQPSINDATIRLLNRCGIEVIVPPAVGCCGSLVHHMGREEAALAQARANTDAWMGEVEGEGLDAIVINASGCGTTVKDYGFMLRSDPAYAGWQASRRMSASIWRSWRCRREPPCRRCASPITRHARCSTARRSCASRSNCSRRRASRSWTFPKAISAAARPGPTIFCNPPLRRNCETVRSNESISLLRT
jgi:glycolate oxidase iron-sulfur subunit